MKRVSLVVGFAIDFASVALFVVDRASSVCDGMSGRPTVPVVIAAKDLPEGVLIDSAAVQVSLWPAYTQPARGYTSIDAVVGRVSGVAIFKGEALVPDRLAPDR